jgi:hypothetical protein
VLLGFDEPHRKARGTSWDKIPLYFGSNAC